MHEPPLIRVQKPVPFVATSGVVEVRQTEVVAELVGEDTQAAVLGLGGVVTDPDTGVAERNATRKVARRTSGAGAGGVDEPAVGPDRVATLRTAAGLFALTGVDPSGSGRCSRRAR